jgi:FkbM family methyltransferase
MVKSGKSGMHPALISPGETVVHAGMWRAETMESWSRRTGGSGMVVVIEGDPKNFEILEFEKLRRKLDNVILVNKAVWSHKDTVTLQSSPWPDFNKLRDSKTFSELEKNAGYKEIRVQGDTIDAILKDHNVPKVHHITLEVSGTELMVLEGMSETLQGSGVRLFVRSILLDDETRTPMYTRVTDKLKSMGFKMTLGPPEENRDGRNIYAAK